MKIAFVATLIVVVAALLFSLILMQHGMPRSVLLSFLQT